MGELTIKVSTYRWIYALQGESFGEISRHLGIARSTISKMVEIYRETGCVAPLPKNNRNYNSKVTYEDSILLETIIGGSGVTSPSEIQSELDTTADCGRVSLSTISRHIRNKLPSCNKYSRKKISKLATERFTNDNVIYTQLYLEIKKAHYFGKFVFELHLKQTWIRPH